MSTAVKAEEAEFEHVNSFPPDISQEAFDLMPTCLQEWFVDLNI